MKQLLKQIGELKKGDVKNTIDSRIKEFRSFRKKGSGELFKEMCFCILTANSTAEQCIRVHSEVGNGFIDLPSSKLQKKLQICGCRFHTKRAGYISEARRHKDDIKEIIESKNEKDAREWLAKNIKGLGMKEASHFLRNIGYENVAIVDFHIVDLLAEHGLVKRPKTMNPKAYLKIENVLEKVAEKAKLSLAELDLYLWYMETGKVLK